MENYRFAMTVYVCNNTPIFLAQKQKRKKRVRNGSVKPHVIIIGILICYVLWADRCRAKQNRNETKVLILFALMSDVTHNVM